jgi:GNAT superfamily N-acetyltransferase
MSAPPSSLFRTVLQQVPLAILARARRAGSCFDGCRSKSRVSKSPGNVPSSHVTAVRWNDFPIPLMLLARLAVAASWQGKGLGAGLLKDAMLRTLQAADIAGIRAMAVHAKDDTARAFYERFDFIPSPSDPFHLLLLLKDIRLLIAHSR